MFDLVGVISFRMILVMMIIGVISVVRVLDSVVRILF